MPPKKRPATAAAPADAAEEDRKRGLLISSKHIARFLQPIMHRKTAEIRNFNCRVISKGSPLFLVESGQKDSNGRGVFKIVARAEFGGNQFVKHADLEARHQKHRCTRSEYESVREHWQTDKGGFVMWDIKVVEVLKAPLFVAARQGEEKWFWRCLVALFE